MKKLICISIMIIIVLAGCGVEIADMTAVPQYCRNTPAVSVEGYPIINPNYCLGLPQKDEFQVNGVRQDSFEGYYAYSVAKDGIGRPPEAYGSTAIHAYMRSFSGNLEIFIQGGAGQWGLGQSIQLQRGCYLLQLEGETDVNDRYNPENYKIGATVFFPDSESFLKLGEQDVPMHSSFDAIFVFFVNSPQTVDVVGYFKSIYGSSGENSAVTLQGFRLMVVPENFCINSS